MLSIPAVLLSLAAVAFSTSCQNTLELTWERGAPDGFERDMIFINGQFPGPTIEANQDDWVEITVVNKMPFNTSIHAHGIEQLNTPWADGVPGFTQRPIQPGESYTYKWHAHQYGSYFYHAHSRGQIEDGCYGPIIIKPKSGITKPFDKIAPAEVELLEAAESKVTPLVVSDWRHTGSKHTWDLQLASGIESSICMDSILLNGKGAVNCWSREDISAFTSPAIAPLLKELNLTMTDKGCLPPKIFPVLLADGQATGVNIDALPKEVFETCTPTEGSVEVIKANPGDKWLALDIISAAGIDTFAFSIDEHPMWVYAVDGHYIEPLEVEALSLVNGDRYSVFIRLDKTPASYGIRVASVALAQLLDTTAVLAYEGYEGYQNTTEEETYTISSTPYINKIGALISENSTTILDHVGVTSFPPQFPQPAPEADQTYVLTLQTVGNSYTWALNGTPFDNNHEDVETPFLYQDPNTISLPNHTLTTKNNTWVDIVFTVPTPGQPPHPIHKHGNKGFILGAGEGPFNWTSVAQASAAIPEAFNLVAPAYRDGFVTPPSATGPTWLAIRYHVTNPGAFLLHCHIQSHLNGGMSVAILDGVDEWPEVPSQYRN
ncbi:multicopper oxidase [Aaosphaeria arxii CBS 175.79]|uniref:Multicopper oxidase n=1 Tax=Aaosphaeria arxii CBS 175.79 TaxID=1450172 RepID=A0A6A5Y609_9PLEO|nr:multicopper oxidase [Aaosphaeria arxii CBS 175.79]KAF2020995.1 multicopper oxidase [Aaosphaeria arxii CBS 175.79]